MSLGGNQVDIQLEEFMRVFEHEKQQKGSVLDAAVQTVPVNGTTVYFHKSGKGADPYKKTTRAQVKNYEDPTFEKRLIQFEMYSKDFVIDSEDLLNSIADPTGAIMTDSVWAHGRLVDSLIYNKIIGTQDKRENGVNSTVSVTNSVAVNDSHYGGSGSDVGLTVNKLKQGKRLLLEGYGAMASEELVCIAPSGQLMNLTSDDQVVSRDYTGHLKQPLQSPGLDKSISGFLGINFLTYEDVGLDGSGDEKIILMTKDAIRKGNRQELKTMIAPDNGLINNPNTLGLTQDLGVARMFEENVCIILCDPLA